MSDYKNALAKFLQSEKNAFAEPQRMLWPFRKDPYTGDMGLGHSMFTESIQNGFNFPAKVMRGEVPMFSEYEDGKVHYSPEMIQGANDTAGLAMTGAIGLPKPANSVGSGGGGKMMQPQATNVAERQANIAKGPRPEPGASQPKAEAMGGSVLAKTEDDYARFLRDVQGQVDEGIDGPFFGPPTPGVVASDVEASARRGFLNEEKYMKSGNDLYAYPVGQGLPEVGDNATIVHLAAALSEAAKASGRSLDIIGDTNYPFRSAYGQLKTPAGSSYKVRVADHSNTSSYHDAPDFNIAPGAMTPNEFMDLLPTIYANPREGAAAAMTTNTGQREENALMNVLRQYGLHY